MTKERFEQLHLRLMELISGGYDLTDEDIYARIDQLLMDHESGCYVPLAQRAAVRRDLFNSIRRLDILQQLLDDDDITEIMVNGTDGIFLEKEGVLRQWDRGFRSPDKLLDIVQQIVAGCNRTANETTAIVDARLSGGARVNIVMPPIALNGPIITIRRFPDRPISMEELIRWGSISQEAAGFLRKLVISGYNIFISGGTGSGKTTFLNALSNYIPKEERLVTIEDNAELQIQNAMNLVRLEARRPNEEGENEVTIRDLIRASLRMRPDRIIVGEVRGEEAIDMLQAMNTGHAGSLSTGHANSPKDMLSRLEMMVLMGLEIPLAAVRRQIATGIDILIHLGRIRDKTRKVLEIQEVDGYDTATGEIRTHSLYEFQETGEDENGKVLGALERTGKLERIWKIRAAGLSCDEM